MADRIKGITVEINGDTTKPSAFLWMPMPGMWKTPITRHLTRSIRCRSTRPYGYATDEDGIWVIDEDTGPVVRKIFEDRLAGVRKEEIAKELEEARVLRPSALKAYRNGIPLEEIKDPFHWAASSIAGLLRNQIYKGTVINFRSRRVSFNSKKRVQNKPEDMSIHEEAVPAIVEKELFDAVQQLDTVEHRTYRADKEVNPLSGLIFCADCGRRMYRRKTGDRHICYVCAGYSTHICTKHRIEEDYLKETVEIEIRKMMRFAVDHSAEFKKIVLYGSHKEAAAIKKQQDDELSQIALALDIIDKRTIGMYQNKVDGILKDEEFEATLSAFNNQRTILEKRKVEIAKERQDGVGKEKDARSFIELCRKFDGHDITMEVMRSLIEKIYIHEGEPIPGKKNRRYANEIEIEWKFLGKVEISEGLMAAYVRSAKTEESIMNS